MGVFKATKWRKKRFRAALERHGTRYEKWFDTEAEALKALEKWDIILTKKFGKRWSRQRPTIKPIGKSPEEVLADIKTRAVGAGAIKRKISMSCQQAACGMIKEAPEGRRCPEGDGCGKYETCLDIANFMKWPGWEKG